MATRHRGVLVALCLGVLVAQTDSLVANLAVREIGVRLHAGVAALQWVVDAYNLAYAVLLLTGGLLGDLYGRRRGFVAGVALFLVGSATCGLAPTIGVLIIGRAVAGTGAALLLPCSLAILRVVWTDAAARGRAIGLWAACNGIAIAIGPTLGGVLIQTTGWRSVFLLILPPAALALALALRAVPESADPHGRHFDATGQITGALTLGALAMAAIQGRDDPRVLAGAVTVSMLAGAVFVAAERRRGAAALVPLGLLRLPALVGALAAAAGMTFAMYGMMFLVPLVWQAADGRSALAAGLALVPMALVFILVSQQSGRLTQLWGARLMIGLGTALIGAALLVLAATRAGLPMPLAQLGLGLAGLGMGLNTGPVNAVAVAAVPAARAGTAAALINVARMVGATLGVAALGAVYALGGGLRAAMLVGAVAPLVGAVVAVRAIEG
ncbi:MAG TPA: MFS transporter [Acetobacteraceae bacterium]|nr:MFS transporter [Acetobacteraceae bacterium]